VKVQAEASLQALPILASTIPLAWFAEIQVLALAVVERDDGDGRRGSGSYTSEGRGSRLGESWRG